MDIDFTGQISSAWRANASLSYIDASVLRDNTLEIGGRLLNVPEVNGSVPRMYEGVLAGSRFGLGGGLTYSGKRLGEARTQEHWAA
jgi:iron complex outermembrane receptor protein